jgi:hypothetical protein
MIAPYGLDPCPWCSGDRSADAKATYRTIERLASAISRARLVSRAAAPGALQELDYRKCPRCGAICEPDESTTRAISDREAAAKLVALKRLRATQRRSGGNSRAVAD